MSLSATRSLLSEQLVFKGLKQGLTLFIPEDKSFTHWLGVLDSQLDQAKNFFQGGAILVELGERKLSSSELSALKAVLTKYKMAIKAYNPLTKKLFSTRLKTEQPALKGVLMVKGTVRNGQRFEHHGDIVVKGDVNPGGELVAAGDIIVLGVLRGIAHAGVRGNLQAEIIALTLSPVQLRIAHIYSRAPEGMEVGQGPEIAHIKGETIVVERL